MIHLFEQPLPSGWFYPCSLTDIQEQLETVPETDVDGLWAVGLRASTRRGNDYLGRYFPGGRPSIALYSYSETLTYKQPPHVTRADLERNLWIALRYGMQLERKGSRWICRWELSDLRAFLMQYVLLHEIGHHVHHLQRAAEGFDGCSRIAVCEQFADAYALRHLRQRSKVLS